tara:strand:- start:86 stop:457 length:372 start_codon:yes stop_codon:yes gene_type:complete
MKKTIILKKIKMRKILQKIAWKTNQWTTKISLFNLYLGGDIHKFGFQILNIDKGFRWNGSLFEITWNFPTVTHAGELTIDILFLFEKWDNWCIDMDDRVLWGSGLSIWEKINRTIHTKFKNIR